MRQMLHRLNLEVRVPFGASRLACNPALNHTAKQRVVASFSKQARLDRVGELDRLGRCSHHGRIVGLGLHRESRNRIHLFLVILEPISIVAQQGHVAQSFFDFSGDGCLGNQGRGLQKGAHGFHEMFKIRVGLQLSGQISLSLEELVSFRRPVQHADDGLHGSPKVDGGHGLFDGFQLGFSVGLLGGLAAALRRCLGLGLLRRRWLLPASYLDAWFHFEQWLTETTADTLILVEVGNCKMNLAEDKLGHTIYGLGENDPDYKCTSVTLRFVDSECTRT